MSEIKFDIGDKVEAVKKNSWVDVGTTGIVEEHSTFPKVCWDEGIGDFYVQQNKMELVEEEEQQPTVEEEHPDPIEHTDATEHPDPVNHPDHYTSHPSGIECIEITEHMGFCLGNAMKYIWRSDLKGDAVEDLKKAKWYIERELEKRDSDDTTKDSHDIIQPFHPEINRPNNLKAVMDDG